jgi:LytS/YehU family sensor histidine kinase
MMGALGTALFAISYSLGQIAPSVALDFSLIGAFIAGFYGGPIVGFVSGLFVGILPGVMFGPLGMGGVFGLIGLPFGKALSGLSAGLIARSLKFGHKPRSSLWGVPSTLLAYVPECIFTYGYFVLVSGPEAGPFIFFSFILPKALLEVSIISILMAALMGNSGFSNFVRAHFTKTTRQPLPS